MKNERRQANKNPLHEIEVRRVNMGAQLTEQTRVLQVKSMEKKKGFWSRYISLLESSDSKVVKATGTDTTTVT